MRLDKYIFKFELPAKELVGKTVLLNNIKTGLVFEDMFFDFSISKDGTLTGYSPMQHCIGDIICISGSNFNISFDGNIIINSHKTGELVMEIKETDEKVIKIAEEAEKVSYIEKEIEEENNNRIKLEKEKEKEKEKVKEIKDERIILDVKKNNIYDFSEKLKEELIAEKRHIIIFKDADEYCSFKS